MLAYVAKLENQMKVCKMPKPRPLLDFAMVPILTFAIC